MSDDLVTASQKYLNETYSGRTGYVPVSETGQTGWPTMFSMIRALQIELGISSPSNNFGDGTRTAFESQIGSISASTTNARIIALLNCALWCKGFPAALPAPGNSWAEVHSASVANIRFQLGLPMTPATVTSKIMKSLLSMDAYVKLPGGTTAIRDGQRWLNGKYLGRTNYYLAPADGLYTRQLQTAIVYGIQFELGMSNSVANGNFGPGTKSGLQTSGTVQFGSADGSTSFVRLYQLALACNGYDVELTGNFDSQTRSATLDFQAFMEIPETGSGNYGTWAALLVSTGDPDRPAAGMDTSTPLTIGSAVTRYNEGYRVVGRYLTVTPKAIVPGELPAIFGAGLKFFPIFQNFNNDSSYFTKALGRDHGSQAVVRARELGLGATPIFFAVDYDATGDEASTIVAEYFRGIREALRYSWDIDYELGVYGTRNVCNVLQAANLVDAVWVSGMSTGYSGNLGFAMPSTWMYNQIKELANPSLDRNIVSRRANPLTSSKALPIKNGAFDPFYWGVKGSGEVFGLMKLQVLAEKQVRKQMDIDNRGAALLVANRLVMYWLEKEAYVSTPFKVYLKSFEDGNFPELNMAGNTKLITARAEFYQEAGDIHKLDPYYGGDLHHAAATAHGVLQWGDEANSSTVQRGDLGGWALDLATLWADYCAAGKPASVTSWFGLHLGGTSYSFPHDDLLADADGWLVGRIMREGEKAADKVVSFAEAWRRVLVANPSGTERIAAFIQGRFSASAPHFLIEDCVYDLFTAAPWSLTGFARDFFLGSAPDPTSSELSDLQRVVYERFMAMGGLPSVY